MKASDHPLMQHISELATDLPSKIHSVLEEPTEILVYLLEELNQREKRAFPHIFKINGYACVVTLVDLKKVQSKQKGGKR
jgi:hypothetical protein